ncbi:hypothetical protein T11_16706 [Trichinella zimbabwensis]|uniref:Uncharacterized protein n=1 Tax=Trichinella zimbabwensis TaxID=268475 RepID=A0A0V1HYC2_9BILA|nr:hypothetical protein T11_16706 [Trichinella zimbabwensis]
MKNKDIKLHVKEALRTGSWSTAAPVPRFQMLAPDWPTGPDMSGNVQTSAFMLAQSKIATFSCLDEELKSEDEQRFGVQDAVSSH